MKRFLQKKENTYKKRSINDKLRYILLTTLIPALCCIIVSLGMLAYYAYEYSEITHNVSVSSQFSITFKDDVDLELYYYVIGINSKKQSHPPVEKVEEAIELAKSLQKTTKNTESKKKIDNVVSYCENLKGQIVSIKKKDSYDERIAQLENNTYVLTKLIQENILEYIYYEARYINDIEAAMERNLTFMTVMIAGMVVVSILMMLRKAFSFTSTIAKPLNDLCENVHKVGKGDFDIMDVSNNYVEIEVLNDGISKMAVRIKQLLENVKKDEKERHKMNLQLLQAQINPHFLYNTLDTIVCLVELGMQEEAINMLTKLSVFFRTTLSKGEDVITLEEEFIHTRSYMEIQQIRYADILEYTMELPEEFKHIPVPKLTIQPLAENALYHGVKEKRGKSTIRIWCEKTEDGVDIVVEDTGIGMTQEQSERVKRALSREEKMGFGLVAVQERIKLYFGEEYGITMTSCYGKGTVVRVHISEATPSEPL